MIGKLSSILRYVKSLGFWDGFLVFIQLEILRSKNIHYSKLETAIAIRPFGSDALVFREIFLQNTYNLPLKVANTIIDGGANIGLASLYLTQRFPSATIYAIEPDHGNFEMLKINAGKSKRIVPIHAGLWHRDTFLKISNPQHYAWALEVEETSDDDSKSIKGISLQSLMERYHLQVVDLLKIDVEGAERELFSENYEYWITRSKNILVEIHDWKKKVPHKRFLRRWRNITSKPQFSTECCG